LIAKWRPRGWMMDNEHKPTPEEREAQGVWLRAEIQQVPGFAVRSKERKGKPFDLWRSPQDLAWWIGVAKDNYETSIHEAFKTVLCLYVVGPNVLNGQFPNKVFNEFKIEPNRLVDWKNADASIREKVRLAGVNGGQTAGN